MSAQEYYNYEEHPRRRRDPSPSHFSGGGSGPPVNLPPTPASPATSAPPPRPVDPRDFQHASTSRINESYGPPSPRETMTLEPPPDSSRARPRSVPPSTTAMIRHRSTPSRSSSDSDSDDDPRQRSRSTRSYRDRSPSPLARARNAVEDNFSGSAAGIGAGLLGAVVGGLVAREATDAATRHKHKSKGYDDRDGDDRTRMVSTILGAVAGGLASNAIANRVEDSREKDKVREREWDRRYREYDERDRYESSVRPSREREAQMDYRRDRALPPPNDDDDDLAYDDSRYEAQRVRRRRSEESYRYRS